MEGPRALDQVTTFVGLQEELLRERDRAAEAEAAQQADSQAHAQTVSKLQGQAHSLRQQLQVIQERASLLETILEQKDTEIGQLQEIIRLKTPIREESSDCESSLAQSDKEDFKKAEVRQMLEVLQECLQGHVQAADSRAIQILQRMDQLASEFTELRRKDNSSSEMIEENSRLRGRLAILEEELRNARQREQQVDLGISQISELAIKKLKTSLAKAEAEKNRLQQQNQKLKASLEAGQKRQQASIQQLFEPSLASCSSRPGLKENDLGAYLQDYSRLRRSMLQAREQEDYQSLIKEFKRRQRRQGQLR